MANPRQLRAVRATGPTAPTGSRGRPYGCRQAIASQLAWDSCRSTNCRTNWTRRRRSRRGGVLDLAAHDGVEESGVDQPRLPRGELLSWLCCTDEVAQPGSDDQLESLWAGALCADAGSLEIGREERPRIGLKGGLEGSGVVAGPLPQVKPIRRGEQEVIATPRGVPVGEPVAPELGRPAG